MEWLRSLSDLFVICFCQLFWTGWCTIFTRRFMTSKNSHFQIEANFKTFFWKWVCMITEKHFHINDFALSLALKQAFEATKKMTYSIPIILIFSNNNNEAYCKWSNSNSCKYLTLVWSILRTRLDSSSFSLSALKKKKFKTFPLYDNRVLKRDVTVCKESSVQ